MKTKINLKNFVLLFIFFVGVLFVVLINTDEFRKNFHKEFKENDIKNINIGGKIINLELVMSDESRSRGLSGRERLKDGEGMLFVFDYPDKYPFWMKDMKFSIDIIWIGEDLKIVYIKKNASPDSYPNSFSTEKDAKYVLEVNSGFSEKNNLKEGDEVEFLP